VGLGIFFTPSILATFYAYYKGKGNLSDGFSRLLTEVPTFCLNQIPGAGHVIDTVLNCEIYADNYS
jgi:hypothetical protein